MARNEVNILPWPAQSPDLNIIENVWAALKNELWNQRASIKNESDVWAKTREIFHNFTLAFFHKLYEFLPERVQSVIDLNGNRTRY